MGGEEEAPCEGARRPFPRSLDDLLSSKEIWLCASCFRCMDRCPRDVGFTNISIALRNLAAREGNIPEALRAMAATIVETGLAYKIPLSRLRMREKQGLPPLPKVGVEQVRALMEEAGLPELVAKKGGGRR